MISGHFGGLIPCHQDPRSPVPGSAQIWICQSLCTNYWFWAVLTSCFCQSDLLDRNSDWERLTASREFKRTCYESRPVDLVRSWILEAATSCFCQSDLLDRNSDWDRLTASREFKRTCCEPRSGFAEVFVLIIDFGPFEGSEIGVLRIIGLGVRIGPNLGLPKSLY